MDKNEVKGRLGQILGIERYISSVLDELDMLRSRTMRITNYGGVSRGSSGGMEEVYDKIAIKCDALETLLIAKEELLTWFRCSLSKLDDNSRAILMDRYVNGYNLRKIANKYHYCDRQGAHRVIDNIIDKIMQ